MKISQKAAIKYYDKFSKVYDFLSPERYYHQARICAIEKLELSQNQVVLNVPIGTGQNLEFFQECLLGTGFIIGVDISSGMLEKSASKIHKNAWDNVRLIKEDVQKINLNWINEILLGTEFNGIDAILVDLGLSGFPNWEIIIDNLLEILKPNGKIVIMDWYLEKPSFRGKIVEWIGKGEINRPIWQYLQPRVQDFELEDHFNRGGVFVASGNKKNFSE